MRQASVLDEFVNFPLVELQTGCVDTANKAKNKLLKLMQYGKRWPKQSAAMDPAFATHTPPSN